MIEIIDIKPMLSGIKTHEASENMLKSQVYASVKKAYRLTGAYRMRDTKELDVEMIEVSKCLVADFKRIKVLRNMRLPEIDACIVWGVQGEFSRKKGDMNYAMIFSWISDYSESPVRIDAIRSYEQDKMVLAPRLAEKCEVSEAENEARMKKAINESYQNYLSNPESEVLDFTNGITRAIYQGRGQKEGEIRDLGFAKVNFLRRKKIIGLNEDLRGFYDKLKLEGREAVFHGE